MRLWLVREVPVAWHSKKSPGSLTNKQTKNPLSFLPKQDCYLNRVNSLSHFLTSTEEGNPWWYEGSSCLQMVCRHLDLQVFPSLQVFPLIFASLSLRHSTGLAQNVPGTTVFLMLHDLCFWGLQAAGKLQNWKWPCLIQGSYHCGKGGFSDWGLIHLDTMGLTQDQATGIAPDKEGGENHYLKANSLKRYKPRLLRKHLLS